MADTARQLLRGTVLTLALGPAGWSGAMAATDAERIAELERRLQQSLELTHRLAERITQLEQARAPAAPAAVQNGAGQAERIERLEQAVAQASTHVADRGERGVPVHGFADVGWAHKTPDPLGKKGGFTLGNLDLYLTPQFGDRVKSIFELVFEYDERGQVAMDLERIQVGHTFSDELTGWVGRFHTPYGYWNTAFHHGAQIQTSILRPRFIAFEDQGGILPSHSVGLLGSGQVRLGGGKLQYDAYLANGSRIADGSLGAGGTKDDNANKALGFNLRYAWGGRLDGLTVGMHGLNEEVDAYDTSDARVSRSSLRMLGGFIAADLDNWELVSEYYRFSNKDLSSGGTHRSWAGFAQAGYALSGGWMPYARVEKAVLDQGDAYFAAQESGRSYDRQVLGLRYNLNPQTALKAEFNRTAEEQGGGGLLKSREMRLQLAVRF